MRPRVRECWNDKGPALGLYSVEDSSRPAFD